MIGVNENSDKEKRGWMEGEEEGRGGILSVVVSPVVAAVLSLPPFPALLNRYSVGSDMVCNSCSSSLAEDAEEEDEPMPPKPVSCCCCCGGVRERQRIGRRCFMGKKKWKKNRVCVT